MYYRRALSSFLIVFACNSLPSLRAQSNAVLSGRVADPTHARLAGAAIAVDGRPEAALSDPNGEFSLHLAPGKYKLNVSREHFTAVSRDVELPAGGLGV